MSTTNLTGKDHAPLRTGALQRWWPTTQSLDLVEGAIEAVAAAMVAEVTRFLGSAGAVAGRWQKFRGLDDVFSVASDFTNIPTVFVALPTRGKWTVLWNNSFGCSGYDALCFCLTMNHGLTTVHFLAHDETTTSEPGAVFAHRRARESGSQAERRIYAGSESGRWSFFQSGEALKEEDLSAYGARRKRDRLNEEVVHRLLSRLGATPWDEGSYDLAGQSCFIMERVGGLEAVSRRRPGDLIRSEIQFPAADAVGEGAPSVDVSNRDGG